VSHTTEVLDQKETVSRYRPNIWLRPESFPLLGLTVNISVLLNASRIAWSL